MLMSLNFSSINEILTSFVQNSLLFLNDTNIKTFGIIACAFFTIIGAGSFTFYRLKDKKIKNISHSRGITKIKEFPKNSKHESKYDSFYFRKILYEFHNLCNNCTNIFSSMKCVELISTYPELINISLSDGLTPFHRVCFHGNDALIEYMLVKGADPELKTVAGENALCMTLYHYLFTKANDFSCLKTLYAKGCYLTYNDDWYKIFLSLSIKDNNTNLTKWLITHSKSQKENSFTRASSVPL